MKFSTFSIRQQQNKSPHAQSLAVAYKQIRQKVKPVMRAAKEKLMNKIEQEERCLMLSHGFMQATSPRVNNSRLAELQRDVEALDHYLYF